MYDDIPLIIEWTVISTVIQINPYLQHTYSLAFSAGSGKGERKGSRAKAFTFS
jgi:hypothetical protein